MAPRVGVYLLFIGLVATPLLTFSFKHPQSLTTESSIEVSRIATWDECNPTTSGHGFVIFPVDSQCNLFAIHHLPEFQCYHYYDVKALVTLPNDAASAICSQFPKQPLYTIAPTLRLPDIARARYDGKDRICFETTIWSGFVDKVIVNSTQVCLASSVPPKVYLREFTAPQATVADPGRLTYLLFSVGDIYIASHYVKGITPDFDHVALVDVSFSKPLPKGFNQWPISIQFPSLDNVSNRIANQAKGTVVLIQQDGSLVTETAVVTIAVDIYPGSGKANGDGTGDFQQYCVTSSRPRWKVCG